MADLSTENVEEAASQSSHCSESSNELLTGKTCSEQYHACVETDHKDTSQEFELSWNFSECHPQEENDKFNKSAQTPTNDVDETGSTKTESHSVCDHLHACKDMREELEAILDDLEIEKTSFMLHFSNKIQEVTDKFNGQPDFRDILLMLNKCGKIKEDMMKKEKDLKKYEMQSEQMLSDLEDLEGSFSQIELLSKIVEK